MKMKNRWEYVLRISFSCFTTRMQCKLYAMRWRLWSRSVENQKCLMQSNYRLLSYIGMLKYGLIHVNLPPINVFFSAFCDLDGIISFIISYSFCVVNQSCLFTIVLELRYQTECFSILKRNFSFLQFTYFVSCVF